MLIPTQLVNTVSPNKPVILVCHDWGSFWSYNLHKKHPEVVAKLICLDIAPWVQPTAFELVAILAYQSFLALTFVLGNPFGHWMAKWFCGIAGAPRSRTAPDKLNSYQSYPYVP
eukprot:TRINITY_DN3747_c1_g1_i2.p1 TRINITY_DN3747_c1_g1~~TRINITY_DN3747_c1_g1_i2.p1  ORF type:complete len:114 (+),score=19.22 TRINITY_DN3747_c1_g1_i2:307-648(+)